jgi:hypothetical protein
MRRRRRTGTTCLVATLGLFGFLSSAPVMAQQGQLVNRTLCLFDFMGANGDSNSVGKDFAAAAQGWGVRLNLRAYTD